MGSWPLGSAVGSSWPVALRLTLKILKKECESHAHISKRARGDIGANIVRIDPMTDQQKSTTRGDRGRETVAAVSEAAELNALDNFLISFVNLPFALVVPALLAAIAGIGWAMVKYA